MKFEDLEVWKRSARMSADLYKELAELRDYGFKDQITRSGLSIPSNIAEGMDRTTSKEKARFLDIAKGSCAELRTQIYIGIDIGYIEKENRHPVDSRNERNKRNAGWADAVVERIVVSYQCAVDRKNHGVGCWPTANCQLPTANCQLNLCA